ncbi:GAF domain-containing protein [Candidatus Uhrbacteria bacterium]|nr:GAF domain-containing protein [Candidatus Uhrbacteria bacterium]
MIPIFDDINTILILVALFNLVLGILVIGGGIRKLANVIYGLNIFSAIGWIIAMVMYRAAPQETALFWTVVLYIAPTFIASSFLIFSYVFPSRSPGIFLRQSVTIILVNLAVVVLTAWPEMVIKQVNVRPGLEKEIIFGRLYWIYVIYTLAFFSYGFYRIYRKFSQSSGVERLQIIYLLFGYALSTNLAFVTNLIMPWLGYFFLNWLGQVFSIFMVGFITYAILRYRLMDVRLAARRMTIWLALSVFTYVVFFGLVWMFNSHLGGVDTVGAYASAVVIAPAFVIVFFGVDRLLRRFFSRYVFGDLYTFQEAIGRLAGRLNHLVGLDKIVREIVSTIRRTMDLDRAALLLCDWGDRDTACRVASVAGFANADDLARVMSDKFMLNYLQDSQNPLVRDEARILARNVSDRKAREGFETLRSLMERAGAAVCLPLVNNDRMIGIIILGDKVSGNAFTKEDLELLDTLAKQAGIAVDNAIVYQEMDDLNVHLEERVAEQTEDIRKKNEHLRELLKMKSEFMDITSHQMKTPIAIVGGYVSLLNSGKIRGTKKRQEITRKAVEGIERLNDVIHRFLASSRAEGMDLAIDRGEADMVGLVRSVCEGKREMAEEKGIGLEFRNEVEELAADLDAGRFSEAVGNLIDNAVFYTQNGKVTVRMAVMDGQAVLEVADTGIGIPEGDRVRIFDRFSRSRNAVKVKPNGSGLGLFIARKIIRAHGGDITLESEEGKGSTFTIRIPLAKLAKTAQ